MPRTGLRRILIVAGGVAFAIAVAAMAGWWWMDKRATPACPVYARQTGTEGSQKGLMTVVTLGGRPEIGSCFEYQLCGVHARVGGKWMDVYNPYQLGVWNSLTVNETMAIHVPAEADAFRAEVYHRVFSSSLPFGIRGAWSRFETNATTKRLQQFTKSVSTPLYDWLWPPHQTATWPAWQTNTVTLDLLPATTQELATAMHETNAVTNGDP